ncbi:MAG: hypothetical protein HY033_13375 [Ignavibacteriae bacterium]|nr:hypothetical protein [Ignavibacteria bacterium]MBI3365884.1 hypothetical protein [Ignavibacteriota bacterium]
MNQFKESMLKLIAIVTMDAHGNSLHANVEKTSAAELAKFAEPMVF